MWPPIEISNIYLGSLVLGLFYGLSLCAPSCLPHITSYIAGVGAGFRRGLAITATYNIGRITAYTLAGSLAYMFKLFIDDDAIRPYQSYASIIFGLVTIIIGASLIKRGNPSCQCSLQGAISFSKSHFFGRVDAGSFAMGLTRGLIICPPLMALLTYAVAAPNPLNPLLLAFLFGLGTAFSPIFLLGGIAGWLLNRATLWKRWISLAGAGILIILGISAILSSLVIL
jgi:thiol:disulfide interchange protein DsbD